MVTACTSFLCCQNPPKLDSSTSEYHIWISPPALWRGCALMFALPWCNCCCLLLLQWAISHPCHLQRGKDCMETQQRAQNKGKSGIFPEAHLMYKYKQEKDAWGGRRQELYQQTAAWWAALWAPEWQTKDKLQCTQGGTHFTAFSGMLKCIKVPHKEGWTLTFVCFLQHHDQVPPALLFQPQRRHHVQTEEQTPLFAVLKPEQSLRAALRNLHAWPGSQGPNVVHLNLIKHLLRNFQMGVSQK